MKQRINIYILLAFLIGLTSCDDYLNIEPEGTVLNNQMFKDFDGYQDAMLGVYSHLNTQNLYGNALSYGLVDNLAHLYYSFPGSNGSAINLMLQRHMNYEYENAMVKSAIDNIWSGAYTGISYINNVIGNAEGEDIEMHPELKIVKGEAYGLRAYLHFDIVRLFCPDVTKSSTVNGVPYATEFTLKTPPIVDLGKTYDKILADITVAEKCLMGDTVVVKDEEYKSDYSNDRIAHLNLYAVWALKSRVYLWKGDLTNAGIYAEKVINSDKFKLLEKSELQSNENYPSTSETIFKIDTRYDAYQLLFDKLLNEKDQNGILKYVGLDIKDVYKADGFDENNEDVRYKSYFVKGEHGAYLFRRLLDLPKTNPDTGEKDKDEINGIAMMRLPEMYYIAAEAAYENDKGKAKKMLNDVRSTRGLEPLTDDQINTKEKFEQELIDEKLKEFWGEGQMFLEYKRLGRTIIDRDGKAIATNDAVFVLPWPDNEIEFGN